MSRVPAPGLVGLSSRQGLGLGLLGLGLGLGLRARVRARAYRFTIMKLSIGLPVVRWDRSRTIEQKCSSSNLSLFFFFFFPSYLLLALHACLES